MGFQEAREASDAEECEHNTDTGTCVVDTCREFTVHGKGKSYFPIFRFTLHRFYDTEEINHNLPEEVTCVKQGLTNRSNLLEYVGEATDENAFAANNPDSYSSDAIRKLHYGSDRTLYSKRSSS